MATPRTPATPSTDVEASQSPIPPRNDHADADSSAQRKRPRLDGGDGPHLNLSAESPSTRDEPHTPTHPPRSKVTQLDGTPSRVTINVRSSLLDKSPAGPNDHVERKATPPSPVDLVPNGSAVTGERESSVLSSPKIEAGEPEDIMPAPSVVAFGRSDDQQIHQVLMDTFPFWAGQEVPLEDTLEEIRNCLVHEESTQRPDIFRNVVEWLERYMECTKTFSDKWFNFCADYREFWDLIPHFVGSILAKCTPSVCLPQQQKEVLVGQELGPGLVLRFLKTYVRLTARMVLIDIRTLQENIDEKMAQPDLLGTGYLRVLARFVSNPENQLLLRSLFGAHVTPSAVAHDCMNTFMSQLPGAFDCVSRFTHALLDRSILEEDALLRCFDIAVAYISDASWQVKERELDAATVEKLQSVLATYFEAVNERLQVLIRKQSPSLRFENLKAITKTLGCLLTESVCKLSIPFTNRLPKDYDCDSHSVNSEHRAYMIAATWRMTTFKECIVRSHMDARIFGVDGMSELLLESHHRYYKDADPGAPLDSTIKYLVDFLRHHRIIHHLIGVGSHPQLVSRSRNIILFLGATKQYSDSDTDDVWNAIRTGQDPRVVESIVELAKQLLIWCTPSQLIYFFDKFQNLPTPEYDARLRGLCSSVVDFLLKQFRREGYSTDFNVSPHTLFVRLLQEVYADPDLSITNKREIRGFAQIELRNLLSSQWVRVDRMSILSSCLQEMSSASPKACGSASIICMILGSEAQDRQVPQLQTQFNFSQEVIEDMSRLSSMTRQLKINVADFQETLTDRLSLTVKTIVNTPESLTEDLIHKMWASLVGEHALNNGCRNAAWARLGLAISHCGPEQAFLVDRILHEHFPNLQPSFFTPEILTFADAVTNYEVRMAQADVNDESSSALQHGDLFWLIALKTTKPDIAAAAIDRMVQHELHFTETLTSGSSDAMPHAHAAFIERAVQSLASAATELKSLSKDAGLDSNATPIAQPTVPSHIKHRFSTSLTILRKFVEQVRSKTLTSPRADSVKSHGTSRTPGDRVSILFQAHAAGKISEKTSFEIGDLATVKELASILSAKTGFSKLNVIVGGARLDLSSRAEDHLRDVPSLFHGLVLVQRLPSEIHGTVAIPGARLNALDREVMKHFHAIYDLIDLDLDFELGREIYIFLSSFPPHEEVVSDVCNVSPAHNFNLPVASIFKCLYCIHALQTTLTHALQEGLPCTDHIAHWVQLVSSAIITLDPSGNDISDRHIFVVLDALACALVRLLKEPMSQDVPAACFSRPEALIGQLSSFITRALTLDLPPDLTKPIDRCYMAILEAVLHSQELRFYVTSQREHASLIRMMLLESRDVRIRESAKRSLDGFLVALRRLPEVEIDRFYAFLWRSLQSWIPDACRQPYTTEHVFSLAVSVFRDLSERNRIDLPLLEYVTQWSTILSEHHHYEIVGRPATNYVALGVASLLRDCMAKSKAESNPLEIPEEMIEKLFRNLLFPDIVFDSSVSAENGRTPVLDLHTRSKLYAILLGDSTKMSRLQQLVVLCNNLFKAHPFTEAWSWGYAQPATSSTYMDPNRIFDGSHATRSSTGYPGLKNLSNTCYMNSLLTQLFMNRSFRNYILNLNIGDPQGSERLVYEVQRLFAYLQESWLHAVDPENVADAIVTYDNTPIDVTIQMDVDEFYNLLFDRLENQIPDTEDKWGLRHFYGGRIVQQIKSKDCPHISERTESFQAIQCEILGKSTLEESLKAYVEGEIMEGDNKYSCSSCGSYVNAVKRACFKDVPDNLIFHLKRFDFDLATGTRSKINDYFQFPPEVDMGPFKVDYLRDTSIPPTPDTFTLVGVLVHTGNAESGHYYSYIRDKSTGSDVWLEFNDSEVTYFDWKAMQSYCFGGLTEGYDHEPFMKPWNAYMLFYRRKEETPSTADQQQRDNRIACIKPSCHMSTEIRIENEMFLRRYCMFDDEYGFFVTALLERFIALRTNTACSDDHSQEREILHFALQHMAEIFSRQRESRHAGPVLQAISRILEGCGECSNIVLIWLVDNIDSFHSLLLKCPMEKERRAIVVLVRQAVHTVRDSTVSDASGSPSATDQNISDRSAMTDPVILVGGALKGMYHTLHSYNRAWEDFFGLLYDIATLGPVERSQLRSLGMLQYVLKVLAVYTSRSCARAWPEFQPLLKAIERRHFSFRKLIAFAELLMRDTESPSETSSSEEGSPNNKPPAGLDPEELSILAVKTHNEHNPASLAVVDAVFSLTFADVSLSERFVATLLHTAAGEHFTYQIAQSILNGLNIDPAVNAEPWLCGAMGFIENSDSNHCVKVIIERYATDAATLVDSGGMVYLNFFERARRAHNRVLMAHEPLLFKKLVLCALPKFGATLLFYPRDDVRMKTLDFLRSVLQESQRTEDESFAALYLRCARSLCMRCIDLIEDCERKRLHIDVRRVEIMQQTLRYFISEVFMTDDADVTDPQVSTIVMKVQGALDTLETIATSSPEELASADDEDSDSGVTEYSHSGQA